MKINRLMILATIVISALGIVVSGCGQRVASTPATNTPPPAVTTPPSATQPPVTTGAPPKPTTTVSSGTIPTRNSVRVVSMTPDSPSTLHFNDKVTVTLEYSIADPTGGYIFAIPFTNGDNTPGCVYQPMGDVIPTGTGTLSLWFSVQNGPVKIDIVRLSMVNGTNTDDLFQASATVDYSYVP